MMLYALFYVPCMTSSFANPAMICLPNKQTSKQTNKQTNKKKQIHTHTHTVQEPNQTISPSHQPPSVFSTPRNPPCHPKKKRITPPSARTSPQDPTAWAEHPPGGQGKTLKIDRIYCNKPLEKCPYFLDDQKRFRSTARVSSNRPVGTLTCSKIAAMTSASSG